MAKVDNAARSGLPFRKQIHFTLNARDYAFLCDESRNTDDSISTVLRRIIREYRLARKRQADIDNSGVSDRRSSI